LPDNIRVDLPDDDVVHTRAGDVEFELRRGTAPPPPPPSSNTADDDPFIVYMDDPNDLLGPGLDKLRREAAEHARVAIELGETTALKRSHLEAIAEVATEGGTPSLTVRVTRQS
jgi:hypothetical protein